jgi:hypothetical protein
MADQGHDVARIAPVTLPGSPFAQADFIATRSWVLAEAHQLAADRWSKWANLLGAPAAVISALTGAAAFSSLPYSKELTGLLALTVAALTASTAWFRPAEKASRHEQAQRDYRQMVDTVAPFLLSGSGAENIEQLMETLMKGFGNVNAASPHLPEWAETRALSTFRERFMSDIRSAIHESPMQGTSL